MIIGEPWGLLALAGIPALVALHLWRARHAPRPVSALFLWPADRRVLASGRTRAPLVLRPSFWLELLAVLAAAWWLADIHLAPREQARHLVLVLDDRWRLQAGDDGTTCAQRLRRLLDQRLAGLAEGDRATLIASGAPPRLLAGPAATPADVRAALARWDPHAAWHDLDPALVLAAGVAGPGAEIVLASDRVPARLPAGVGAIAAGRAATGSGLADARWWRDAGGERIVAVVRSDRAGSRRLALNAGGIELAAADLALDPAHPAVQVFDRLPALPEGASVELALAGSDPLPIDDRALLVRPPTRTVRARVLLDGPAGAAVRAALTAAGASLAAGEPDLVVGGAPTGAAWALEIVPGDGKPTLGPFTAQRSHPLLRDVDFTGVIWSGSAAAGAGLPLLLSGDRDLVTASAGGPGIVLHLDPARSNLFQASAWPVLVANLVAWRAAALPGIADPDPRCGQPVAAVLPPGNREAVLRGPDGAERRLRAAADGALSIPGLELPGTWRLQAGDASWAISALPLDARQADLRDAATTEVAAVAAGTGAVERRRGALAALLPIVLAAGAALAAWTAFRREDAGRPTGAAP